MKPVIGKTVEGRKVEVDPKALIAGHLLIQASSGGGKSWLIRKLLEETFGTYFSKLRSNGLVEVNGEWVKAGEPLLWEPGKEARP